MATMKPLRSIWETEDVMYVTCEHARIIIFLVKLSYQSTFNMASSELIRTSIDDVLFDAVVNMDVAKAVLAIDNGADVNIVARDKVRI